MEIEYKAIGKRIKIACIQADLTQEKLSDIGVSYAEETHVSSNGSPSIITGRSIGLIICSVPNTGE